MKQGAVYQASNGRKEANGEWRVANGEQGEERLARDAVTLTIRHSPFAIRHSPFAIRHSPFTTHHSLLAIHHSPLTIPHSPLPAITI
jgi:hypothetical protein